jgi:hypothetical protein
MKIVLFFLIFLFYITDSNAQTPPKNHPDVTSSEWNNLFKPDLSNAGFPKGIWFFENGILTATEDQAIWTEKTFDNFILDLEFKTAQGTNSGVFVYASDTANWITDAVEVHC